MSRVYKGIIAFQTVLLTVLLILAFVSLYTFGNARTGEYSLLSTLALLCVIGIIAPWVSIALYRVYHRR